MKNQILVLLIAVSIFLAGCSGTDSANRSVGLPGGGIASDSAKSANGYGKNLAESDGSGEDMPESDSSDEIAEDTDDNMGLDTSETIDREKADKSDSKAKTLTEEKIVYNGDVSIESLAFTDSKKKLHSTLKKYDGIIQNENESNFNEDWYTKPSDSLRSLTLTARIPSENFHKFMSTMGDVGNVTSSSSDAQNITTEYYDTKARIKSLKTELKRLRQLLGKADSLSDILEIQDRISNVEYELDSAQSRLAGMDLDVQYSTVTISLREVSKYSTNPTGFFQKIGEAIVGSARFFVQFIQTALIVFIYAAPVLLVIGLVMFVIFKLISRIIKKRHSKRKATPASDVKYVLPEVENKEEKEE